MKKIHLHDSSKNPTHGVTTLPHLAISIFVLTLFAGLKSTPCHASQNDGESLTAHPKGIVSHDQVIVKEDQSDLLKRAKDGDYCAQYELAFDLRNENSTEAFVWFERAAKGGHLESKFLLATMYFMGKGCEQDREKGGIWMVAAAKAGHAKAQNAMGLMLVEKQEWNKAFHWFEKAAKQGLLDAKENLAYVLFNTWHMEKDLIRAFSLFKETAETGYPHAMCNLGMMYQDGLGCVQSSEKAKYWFEKALNNPSVQEKARELLKKLADAEEEAKKKDPCPTYWSYVTWPFTGWSLPWPTS